VVKPRAEKEVALKRHADEIRHRILRLFRKLFLARLLLACGGGKGNEQQETRYQRTR
jgi:hypothetical protein